MKKTICLFAILILGITACHKLDTISNNTADTHILQSPSDSIKTSGGGSELIYHADYNDLEYDLLVRFLDSVTVDYILTISQNAKILREISNKATFAPKAIYTIEGKYSFAFSGIKFLTDENPAISIFIQESDSSYASFRHSSIPYGNSQLSIWKDAPVMFRCGTVEPYNEYLRRTFSYILEYYNKTDEESGGSKHRSQKLKKYLTNLRVLLAEIKSNQVDYNDLNSLSLLRDQTMFYEMDSVRQIFIEYGVGFDEKENDTPLHQHQLVSNDTDKNILVTVKVDKTGRIIRDRFVNIEITDALKRPKNLRMGELPFFGRLNDFKKYDGKTIAIFRDFGFESVNHIISIWEQNDDSYELSTILDQSISVGIGAVQLDTLFNLSSDKYLIIGEKSGGDAGDIWGSLWVGIWTKPRALEVVYEKHWEGSDWLGFEEVIDYSISDGLVMTIDVWKRYGSQEVSEKDSLISSENIDLKVFR